ncbi:MAG: hypothetical protein Kow0037_31340 [Calditrichia bacterium]
MKRFSVFSVMATMMILLLATMAFAQPQRGWQGAQKWQQGEKFYPPVPNLTDEQKQKIDELRVPHLRKMQDLRNQVMEKRARLHTLSTADKPNMGEINKVIDEIGKLRTQIMKERQAHRQQIRGLLTEEQRVIFDSRPMRMGKRGKGSRGHGGFGPGSRGVNGCGPCWNN